MNSFETSGLKLWNPCCTQRSGFCNPDSIQQQTLQQLLIHSRKDLIALAQTGTAKRRPLFAIAAKSYRKRRRGKGITLAPTRELCLQITNDIKAYTKIPAGHSFGKAVYSGANITTQISALKEGAQIV